MPIRIYFSFLLLLCFGTLGTVLMAGEVDPDQAAWYKKYKSQANAPDPAAMLLNTDPEPDLSGDFTSLFNGKDLTGWTPKGGTCKFEVVDGCIQGTVVKGSNSTYLCTDQTDFEDFVFTCEMRWVEDSNSGVMFRAQVRGKKGNKDETKWTVYGPQAEMEGFARDRGWSGGIYGQSCGGYFYPLWLKAHQEVRSALKKDDWNRVTISAKGNVMKTWVNGIPAAHWVDDGTYAKGFFGLQMHKGGKGVVLFRDIRIQEQ